MMELPALTERERAGLVESIQQDGIKYPVLLDPTGKVIDGHHRQSIAAELGIDCPTVTLDVTPEQADRLAISLNVDRRQLDRNTRHTLCIELRKMQKSVRQIAEETGLSKSVVDREISTVPLGTVEDLPKLVVGKDGKTRDAKTRDYQGIYQRRKTKAAQQQIAAAKRAELRDSNKRVAERNRNQLDNSARNAPPAKLNLPALNRARKLREDLQAMARLVPADRFVSQLPAEACREFTPEFVDWWLEVSRLAAERFEQEGDGIPPLPASQRWTA